MLQTKTHTLHVRSQVLICKMCNIFNVKEFRGF